MVALIITPSHLVVMEVQQESEATVASATSNTATDANAALTGKAAPPVGNPVPSNPSQEQAKDQEQDGQEGTRNTAQQQQQQQDQATAPDATVEAPSRAHNSDVQEESGLPLAGAAVQAAGQLAPPKGAATEARAPNSDPGCTPAKDPALEEESETPTPIRVPPGVRDTPQTPRSKVRRFLDMGHGGQQTAPRLLYSPIVKLKNLTRDEIDAYTGLKSTVSAASSLAESMGLLDSSEHDRRWGFRCQECKYFSLSRKSCAQHHKDTHWKWWTKEKELAAKIPYVVESMQCVAPCCKNRKVKKAPGGYECPRCGQVFKRRLVAKSHFLLSCADGGNGTGRSGSESDAESGVEQLDSEMAPNWQEPTGDPVSQA